MFNMFTHALYAVVYSMFYCICILVSAQQNNVGTAVAMLSWWPAAKPPSTFTSMCTRGMMAKDAGH